MTSVTLYPPGVPVSSYQPGDFGLTHGSSFVSRGIQVAQRLRFRGVQREYAHWNHAFLVTSADGDIVEAGGKGIEGGHVSDYDAKEVHLVHVDASDEDRKFMVQFADYCMGRRYGYLTIISLVFQLITGARIGIVNAKSMICSGFVAEALEMAGYDWPVDPAFIMPADLAARFEVRP